MAASVPVYKGAPNIRDFLPGPNSAILIDNFKTPEDLANHLIKGFLIQFCQYVVGNDEQLWLSYFDYQNYEISSIRQRKVDPYTKVKDIGKQYNMKAFSSLYDMHENGRG